jgi:hypothetical protein
MDLLPHKAGAALSVFWDNCQSKHLSFAPLPFHHSSTKPPGHGVAPAAPAPPLPTPCRRLIPVAVPCGVAVATARRQRTAAPLAVGAPGDRTPAPPRGRAPVPRHARPCGASRRAHAAPPRRSTRRRCFLIGRRLGCDAVARPRLCDAPRDADGAAGRTSSRRRVSP